MRVAPHALFRLVNINLILRFVHFLRVALLQLLDSLIVALQLAFGDQLQALGLHLLSTGRQAFHEVFGHLQLGVDRDLAGFWRREVALLEDVAVDNVGRAEVDQPFLVGRVVISDPYFKAPASAVLQH